MPYDSTTPAIAAASLPDAVFMAYDTGKSASQNPVRKVTWVALTNAVATTVIPDNLLSVVNATQIKAGGTNGIPATIDVLIHDLTTNRLVFVSGILVSNITTFYQ